MGPHRRECDLALAHRQRCLTAGRGRRSLTPRSGGGEVWPGGIDDECGVGDGWARPACSRLLAVFLVTAVPDLIAGSAPAAGSVPTGFATTVTQSELVLPTSFAFARDGRLFVAEKRGTIQTYDSVDDETPSLFADLRRRVHNHVDRGLLSIEVDPGWPLRPYVYVLYSHDAPVGRTAPVYGGTTDSDPCPSAGCPAQTVIARLAADAAPTMTASTNLVSGCTQFPHHDGGGLRFSADGVLYAGLGEGATYLLDFGQRQGNPCGDPPNEGGALRSQDARTAGDPLGRSGTLLRLDPDTGATTMLAYGLRNPYRIAPRPSPNQVWIGDVGLEHAEELNRFDVGGPLRNYGWPCFEGNHRQVYYDGANLPLCESLYTEGSATPPADHYCHSAPSPSGLCGTGGGAISALAWYGTGSYPAAYHGALFFADYTRETIYVKRKRPYGLHPIETFATGIGAPVDLRTGPAGDLFYANVFDGTIVRIYVGEPGEPPPEVPKPTATIDQPTPATKAVVGEQLAFSGSAARRTRRAPAVLGAAVDAGGAALPRPDLVPPPLHREPRGRAVGIVHRAEPRGQPPTRGRAAGHRRAIERSDVGRPRPPAEREVAGRSEQGGVERDGRAGQRLADRAVGLRLIGGGAEVVLGEPRHRTSNREVDAGDALAGLEGDVGRRLQALGRTTRLGEGVGQGHREAGGVGGGDQLLGARAAVGFLGPRRPGEVEGAEAGRLERHLPLAVHERAFPVGRRGAGGGHADSLGTARTGP